MAVEPDSPDLRSNFNRLRGETGEEERLGIGSHGLTRNGRTLTSCALGDGAADANHFVMSAEKLGIRGDFAKLAGPLRLAAYTNGLLYYHGGASLQECVVPVISLQLKQAAQPGVTQATVTLGYKNGAKRITTRVPVIEMPKNSSEFLTSHYGFITAYLAEAFHYQLKQTNRYEEVSKRIRPGEAVEGRDEKGIKKTVCAFLKILHPHGPPDDVGLDEYVAYAVEMRRRMKEQMNKRKTDDEFGRINLSIINSTDDKVVVYCRESRAATATQEPSRRNIHVTTQGAVEQDVTAPAHLTPP